MFTPMQIGCQFRNLQMANTCKLAPPQIFQSLVAHLKLVAVVKIVPAPTKFVVVVQYLGSLSEHFRQPLVEYSPSILHAPTILCTCCQ